MSAEHLDVIVIGAGLSGVGMACHLAQLCPGKQMAILERRHAIGGTWDLFRYPGVRSDSDMFSFGYQFRPWNDLQVLADGESIRRYINDTAAEHGIIDKIRFGVDIIRADWSTTNKLWTLTATRLESGENCQFTCHFLISCTGYYNYHQGYLPTFPGVERFQGQCIHPQAWPQDLDYRDKKSRNHRQRRDGDYPGAGDGQYRSARHHGATLALLYFLCTVPRCAGRLYEEADARALGLSFHAAAQYSHPTLDVPRGQALAQCDTPFSAQAGAQAP